MTRPETHYDETVRCAEQVAQERADFPLGGGKHTFTISVNMRGSGCDWSDDLVPVTVQAFSLVAALQLAIERPFGEWMDDDTSDD